MTDFQSVTFFMQKMKNNSKEEKKAAISYINLVFVERNVYNILIENREIYYEN